MDKLYIGDIPNSYHYAIFSDNHIDLYNRENLTNGTYDFYRIYYNYDGFLYSHGSQNYSSYNTTYATSIDVTDDFYYRKDFSDILLSSFIYIVFIIFLLNIVTSAVKKGGSLGGLL